MSPTLIWVCVAIVFLLIEMGTVTLYGSVVAIGCFVAAAMAYSMGEFHWLQILACLVVVIIGSYFVPKFFDKSGKKLAIGLDAYIGQEGKIKMVDDHTKIVLDGVEYLVKSEETLKNGQKVKIIAREGSVLVVR